MNDISEFLLGFIEGEGETKEEEGSEKKAPFYWEGVYLLLSFYEKVLLYSKFVQLEKNKFLIPKLWVLLPSLLSHSHVWIRCGSFFIYLI